MRLSLLGARRLGLCAAAIFLMVGCSKEDVGDQVEAQLTDSVESAARAATSVASSAPATPADSGTALQRADSLDRMLRRVRALSRWEQMKLRRDVNAKQIDRARQLGIQPSSDLDRLVAQHALVRLPDNNRYWSLHHLDYSVPYVTPSTSVLLAEIAERFQTRLDSLKAPRLRLVITSALRTPQNQDALRRRNFNASKIESAHEFGTTVDIAYRRFAAPADNAVTNPVPPAYDPVRDMNDSLLVSMANKRSTELQAILGRVLQELSNEGMVMVMMERRQTVYHITVARQLKARAA